jgi:hypothetical protein
MLKAILTGCFAVIISISAAASARAAAVLNFSFTGNVFSPKGTYDFGDVGGVITGTFALTVPAIDTTATNFQYDGAVDWSAGNVTYSDAVGEFKSGPFGQRVDVGATPTALGGAPSIDFTFLSSTGGLTTLDSLMPDFDTALSNSTFSGISGTVAAGGELLEFTVSDYTLSVSNVASAPIPAALPLFASALGGLGVVGWKRRKSAATA